jgi:hypothetical protein
MDSIGQQRKAIVVQRGFYNFGKGSQALYQQDGGEKTRAFSVRCVKSIDSLK